MWGGEGSQDPNSRSASGMCTYMQALNACIHTHMHGTVDLEADTLNIQGYCTFQNVLRLCTNLNVTVFDVLDLIKLVLC